MSRFLQVPFFPPTSSTKENGSVRRRCAKQSQAAHNSTTMVAGGGASRTIFQRAADIAHRGVIIGIASFMGFQIYQIGRNFLSGERDNQAVLEQSTYWEEISARIKREEHENPRFVMGEEEEEELASREAEQFRPHFLKPEFLKAKKEEQEKKE